MQLGDLRPIGLDELSHQVALQTRVDRKYVLHPGQLERLIARVAGDARILDIDGRRTFDYRSIYFDTPAFDSYLGAARRRSDRFKVRIRCYLDSTTPSPCWVEVKLRNRRGQTVKHRHPHDPASLDELVPTSLSFVASFPRLRDLAHQLDPMITTGYRRSTLVVGSTRVTIDVDVAASAGDGRAVTLGGDVIVETKSTRSPGVVDRALWDLGIRPSTISKFAIGAASLFPELPANKWTRTLRDHVHVSPAA